MKQRIAGLSLVTILVLSVALLFQNCSEPFGTTTESSSYAENLPFAYDATVDTIAYMSCAGGDAAANQQAIWTFRAGAYGGNSGIRLRDDFLNATRNFSIGQRAEALSQSAQNANAVLQLSIRPMGQLQSLLTGGGGTAQAGSDFASLAGPLNSPEIAIQLAATDLSNPQRVNFFPGIEGTANRFVEGAVRFVGNESVANYVRGELAGNAVLAMTYSSDIMPDVIARGPGGPSNTSTYGRGFKVDFGYVSGESAARVMTSIQELDLSTGRVAADASQWVCSADMRFRIARLCSECSCTQDSGDPVTLQKVRSVLKTEHWYVNLASRCVVQKTLQQQCYPQSPAGNYHFVSLCFRQ